MRILNILTLATALSALSACGISDCKEDANACATLLNENGQTCAEALTLKQGQSQRKYCERALKVVTKQRVKAAIPGLKIVLSAPETRFPDDKHRLFAAKALGAIGDTSVVPDLIAAIDFSAGVSSDKKDKNANRTNEEIAKALGKLGDKRAGAKLQELAEKSPNNYVVLKSIRALGQLRYEGAVEGLSKMALTHSNKFMRKNAVIALGDIGDLRATDALVQAMFVEYQGVSFYKEASFALYQLGPKVADALLATMDGKNEAVNQHFAKIGGLKTTAIKAKCGFVLGDLRDARAVQPLIEAFVDAKKRNDPVVMIYAAAPLGALGDKRAVPALAKEMLTVDSSQRDPIMRALNQLGDRSVAPAMIAAMTKADFVAQCVKQEYGSKEECGAKDNDASAYGAQKSAADHASNLAGAEHLALFTQAVEGESNEKMKAYLSARLARVKAASECKQDAACWTKRMSDADPLIREKAAWELGRIQDNKSLDALASALGDPKPHARSAAIMSYWSFGDNRAVSDIEKRLVDEEAQADFIKVNEDLKRLLVHLKRGNG